MFMYLIANLQKDARQILDKKLQKFDLTRYEWLSLLVLENNKDPISQAVIRDYLGVDNSYLTKVLDKLEKKNFIERIIDKKDRRSRLIKPSELSQNLRTEIYQIAFAFNEQLLKPLSQDEKHQLFGLIHKVHSGLK